MAHDGHEHDDHHHHDAPHHQHRVDSPSTVSTYLITCSDSRDAAKDESGAVMRALLEGAGHSVTGQAVILDEAAALKAELEKALSLGARAIAISGGTGLSRRDVTIETLTPMFEKTLDGFGELFRHFSFDQVGSAAMLSRAVAGSIKGAIVFALPGSPRAVELAFKKLILPELGHLVRELSR